MNASAITVQISGRLPAASPRRAYDILVRVPSRVTEQADAGSLARPTDLAELSGGITLAEYDTIRRLPGVQVAAPMTLVGYVPLTVVIPVAVPADALTSVPALFTVTAERLSDDGLTTVTQRDVGTTYVSADQPAPPICSSAQRVDSSAGRGLATCWSASAGLLLQTWTGPRPTAISVPLAWTFLLPLVAVDPLAEAKLLHLDRAVVQGRYLPSTPTRSGPVPMIMASSIADDAQDDISLAQLPRSAALSYGGSLTAEQVSTLLAAAPGRTVATAIVTASRAYADLLDYLRGSTAVRVPAYWTSSPAHYVVGADGALTPRPVGSDGGFRALTLHAALPHVGTHEYDPTSHAGAVLRAVGVFDPARIASSAATPSPYRGEKLSAADAQTLRLLGGGTLGPDGNPAGYPSPGATLVMPLQDIGAFTAAAAYSGTDAAAPIGSIRVRVAGVTGDDAMSRERVSMVAQEIVRATGLRVDVTLAASATTRTIDLATGGGRPTLRLHEVWYRSDTSTAVSSSVDPRSIVLSAGVLLIGSAFVASGVMATLRHRRREVATLRALGWRRRRLAWRLGREFVLIAAAAGIVSTLAAYTLEALVSGRLPTAWALLSMPTAAGMTLAAAWWQLRRATGDAFGFAETRTARPTRSANPRGSGTARLTGSRRRAPWRSGLALAVTVVACAAFGLELAVQWIFGGVIVGSWLGYAVSWQLDTADLIAVIVILALATITMTDIGWRNGAERSAELRTLRAIGWPAYGVARLAASEALVLGLVGGAIASALDVAVILAIVQQPPPRLALAAMAAIGLGGTMSLVTVTLSAAVERTARALA
jgi:putative ABC transport system permease protein